MQTGQIGFWPSPLGDEPLFSILARLRAMLGVKTADRLLRLAFGMPPLHNVDVHLPDRLQALTNAIGSESADEADLLITRHTSLPYLMRFFAPGELERVRSEMLGSGRNTRMPKAFGADSRSARTLAFCPQCAAGDVRKVGMAGWRRVHQMPGVFICPTHDHRLRFTATPAKPVWDLEPCPTDPEAGRLPELPFSRADAFSIAKGSKHLLDAPSTPVPDIAIRMTELLEVHGFAPGKDAKFKESFGRRFPEAALAVLRWTAGPGKVKTPLAAFSRTSTGLHGMPVRYLALLLFLDIEPVAFFAMLGD